MGGRGEGGQVGMKEKEEKTQIGSSGYALRPRVGHNQGGSR